jgi:hypothetical protein
MIGTTTPTARDGAPTSSACLKVISQLRGLKIILLGFFSDSQVRAT